MTAEIAIINRVAVTLAADSAVSIGEKIYNSADKIFELCVRSPIGMMIYNALDFLQFPLDVAIKHFRELNLDKEYLTVGSAADNFFEYLKKVGDGNSKEGEHVYHISLEVFREIKAEFDRKLLSFQQLKTKKKNSLVIDHEFSSFLQEIFEYFSKIEKCNSLDGISSSSIALIYSKEIEESIAEVFKLYPLKSEHVDKLKEIIGEFITSKELSSHQTGFVFCGFGKDELFPSIYSYHVDGMVSGRLKIVPHEQKSITQEFGSAAIIPFAQREMVDRFLMGIDPAFEAAVSSYFGKSLTKTVQLVIDGMGRMSQTKKNTLRQLAAEAAEIALDDFHSSALDKMKNEYRKDILNMVSVMPKPELAHFAESLINTTSLKRKVSAEQESVGGPIDVAVISRSEGFVWVKRKHYFDPALNPRFFQRKYATKPDGNGGTT